MNNATILYYSSNREDPAFEQRIVDTWKKNCGDLPIVSVTHKPMDLGKNICVGEHEPSGFNMFRQVQIGLKEIDTEFVISAESDCLYPPDYFTYRPPRNDMCYRNSNLYVMPDYRDYYFYKEEGATHAQIVGKEFYLQRLNHLFGDAPEWSTEEMNFPKERHGRSDVFWKLEHYKLENPVIQIKTHKGMRYYTRSDRTPILTLPYWGDGKKVRQWYVKGHK